MAFNVFWDLTFTFFPMEKLSSLSLISDFGCTFFLPNEGRCLSCWDRWQLWSQSSSWCSLGCSQWWRCKTLLTVIQRCLCSILDEMFFIFLKVLTLHPFLFSISRESVIWVDRIRPSCLTLDANKSHDCFSIACKRYELNCAIYEGWSEI